MDFFGRLSLLSSSGVNNCDELKIITEVVVQRIVVSAFLGRNSQILRYGFAQSFAIDVVLGSGAESAICVTERTWEYPACFARVCCIFKMADFTVKRSICINYESICL